MRLARKHISKIILLTFVLSFFLCSLCLAVDNTEPIAMPEPPMVRAMGGAFTAVADDENAVFYNPAGYGTIDDRIISVFSLGVKANIDDPAINLWLALLAGANLTAPENMNTYLSNVTLALGAVGPMYFGRVGNNYGFAFFDNFSFRFTGRPGAMMPYAILKIYSDVGFVGGYGIELPFLKNLYAGFNFKVVLRIKSEVEGTALAVMDSISNMYNLPTAKAIGFGGDLGVLYKPLSWLSFGLAAKDFFGTHFASWQTLSAAEATFEDSCIKPRIAFGVAFYPLKTTGEGEPKNIKDFVIALDYSDLLDYSSVFTNIKVGISFNTLNVINIRAGFDGGYLTGGIGFDLNFFHTNIVYFVDELGSYPGANPVQNLMLNFAFRW